MADHHQSVPERSVIDQLFCKTRRRPVAEAADVQGIVGRVNGGGIDRRTQFDPAMHGLSVARRYTHENYGSRVMCRHIESGFESRGKGRFAGIVMIAGQDCDKRVLIAMVDAEDAVRDSRRSASVERLHDALRGADAGFLKKEGPMGPQQREQDALGGDTALGSLPHFLSSVAGRTEQRTELFGSIVASDEAGQSQEVGSIATGENDAPPCRCRRIVLLFFRYGIRCRLQSHPPGLCYECVR